jgi:hypothetical protein
LAAALKISGIDMTPEEAGKLFPFVWPPEHTPEID